MRRRAAAALALGGAAAAALPPLFLFPLVPLSAAGLLLLLLPLRRARDGFAVAFAFGLGFFGGGLWWVAAAFAHGEGAARPLAAPAAAALAAALALPWGAAGALLCRVRGDGARAAALPALLCAAELLRDRALGFPWNHLASPFAFSAASLQPLALVGPHAWAALVLLSGAALGLIARDLAARRRPAAAAAAALLLAPALAAASTARLAGAAPGEGAVGARLRIVQPAHTPAEKRNPALAEKRLRDLLELSRGGAPVDVLVWPESSFPFDVESAPRALAAAAAAAPPGGTLVLGAVSRGPGAGGGRPGPRNSVYALGPEGAPPRWRYDKRRLVPFGEFLPLRRLLPAGLLDGAEALAGAGADFVPGEGLATLPGGAAGPVSPLVCFEIIHPGRVARRGERPRWIVNLTNDAWFGRTPGPAQHLAAARMRAVEEGLPVARAANSGISAVFGPLGRQQARLESGRRGALDARLPPPRPPTPYVRMRPPLPDAAPVPLLLAAAAVASRRARRGQAGARADSPLGCKACTARAAPARACKDRRGRSASRFHL